jgi:hypothetical protein
MTDDNWNPPEEARMALQIGELLEPAMADLRARLPEGIHCGIIIVVPNPDDPKAEGRAIAITTDRRIVGLAAAQWIMNSEPFGPRRG